MKKTNAKKIELLGGEMLDDVVEMLLKEKAKGNHTYCMWCDEIRLDSDTVTIENAYIAVVGCTRAEYERKLKEESERIHKILDDPDAINETNALKGILESKRTGRKKNGKYYSPKAEEYLNKLKEYSNYCMKGKKEEYVGLAEKMILAVTEDNMSELESQLIALEDAGLIMKEMAGDKSWEEIKDYAHSIIGLAHTASLVAQYMLEFSQCGVGYVNNVMGKACFKAMPNLVQKYKATKSKK